MVNKMKNEENKIWEVRYAPDESMPRGYILIGAYETRNEAKKEAINVMDNIAYGEIYIYNTITKRKYKQW